MLRKILAFIILFQLSFLNAQEVAQATQSPQDSIVRISVGGESFLGVQINDTGDILTLVSYFDQSANSPVCVYKKQGDKLNFYKSYIKFRDINSGLTIVNVANLPLASMGVSGTALAKGSNAKLLSMPEKNALEMISLLGWAGISSDLQSQIDAINSQSLPAEEVNARINALLVSKINEFIATLPKENQFDLNPADDTFNIDEGGLSILDISQANSPFDPNGATISVALAKSYFLQGAPLVDLNGNLLALSFLPTEKGETIYLNADEIIKFLTANNVPFTSTKGAGGSMLFITDYIVIISIILFAIIIFIVLMIRSSRGSGKKMNFATLAESTSPKIGGQYTPSTVTVNAEGAKIMASYSNVFSKVKSTSVSEIVAKIKKLISDNSSASNINLYKTAKEYKDIQEEADRRLSKCIALIDKNSPDEAINMATAYPSLIDLVNDLQFKELDKWIIYCGKSGVPTPSKFAIEDLEKLNSLLSNLKSENVQNSMKLRKYVSLGNLKAAIELLECACSLNPDNKDLQAQLMTLKSSFLDKEISRISKLAQSENHEEALTAYDELSNIIPDSLKENNARWDKMSAYSRSLKLQSAQEIFKDTLMALRNDRVDNWKETVDLVLVARECLEKFPELEEFADLKLIETKKNLALDLKNKEIADRDFEYLCQSVIAFVNGVKEIFAKGKASKNSLELEIAKADKLWDKLKIETRQVPDAIYKAYEKCVKYLHSEVKDIQTRKKRLVLSLIMLIFLAVGSVSFISYNNAIKREAYAEYDALLSERVSSEVLEEALYRLDQKYSQYLSVPEFFQKRQDIINVALGERAFEGTCQDFISKAKAYTLSKLKSMKSIEIKSVENEIYADYTKLSGKALPKTKEELDSAKTAFDVSLENYKNYIAYKINSERDKAMDSLNKIKKHILKKYENAEAFDEELAQFENTFNKLKSIKDPYVAALRSSDTQEYSQFIESANSMASILANRSGKFDTLEMAKSYEEYLEGVKEVMEYYTDNNISDDASLKKVKTFYLKKDRILLKIANYFKEQSNVVTDLYAGKDAVEKSGKFKDLSLAASKDAFALDFAANFPFWLRNIYEYNYESFNRSDIPLLAKMYYTVSKAEVLETARSDIEYYKGSKILENLSIDTEFKTLNTISLKENNEDKISTCNIINVKYLTKESISVERLGEHLVNGKESPQSLFLASAYMQVYDDNMQDIMPSVAILEVIKEIVSNDDVDENFKVYMLDVFMNLVERYVPLESGLFYSPTLMKLKEALASEKSKDIFKPLSWLDSEGTFLKNLDYLSNRFDVRKDELFARFLSSLQAQYSWANAERLIYKNPEFLTTYFKAQNYYYSIVDREVKRITDTSAFEFSPKAVLIEVPKGKLLSPNYQLKDTIASLSNSKISLLEEANACFDAVVEFNEPKHKFYGYFDLNSKFHKGVEATVQGSLYFYFDVAGNLQVSKALPSKALPFSPVLAVLDKQEYLKEIVRKSVGENAYIYDSVFKRLYSSSQKN